MPNTGAFILHEGLNGTPTSSGLGTPWWAENATDLTGPTEDRDPTETSGNELVITTAERVVETLLLSAICTVAFTGNALLWCVVLRNRTLRTCSNALVLCLSSADLLVSLFNMPTTVLSVLSGGWVLGPQLCVLLGFTNMTFFIGSVMSLAAISINRYVLIVHPKRFKTIYTTRNTALCILAVWLLSMALASPPLLGWARYDYLPGQSFCFCHWESSISYTFFMVIVCFGGPCSVMSFCYYNILRQVRMSRKRLAAGAAAEARVPTSAPNGSSSAAQQNGGDRKGSTAPSCGGNEETTVEQLESQENGTAGGKAETTKQTMRSRVASFRRTLSRQFSRQQSRVEPNHPELSPGERRPASLPARVPCIQILDDPPSVTSQVDGSPSRYRCSPNQSPSRAATGRGLAFNRSVSLDTRRKCQIKVVGELTGRLDGGEGGSSPQRQRTATKVLRQLSASNLLTLPGRKAAGQAGVRRKRAKTQRELRRKQEELRLTKSFLVVILVFICCWFPFCLTMFWSVFSPYPVYRPVDMASLLLGFFNSCCNPVIYGVMNTRFRAGFKHLLCCHWTPCYRAKGGRAAVDRGLGSVTGTAVGTAYNDNVSVTAD